MTAHAISQRGLQRRRDQARAEGRFIVLAVAVCAVGVATWLAPAWVAPLVPTPAPEPRAVIGEPPKSTPPAVRKPFPSIAHAPTPVPAPQARARASAPIPLDAPDAVPADDFEVLSAHELAAIGQEEADAAPQFSSADQAATTAPEGTSGARANDVENQGGPTRRRTRRR